MSDKEIGIIIADDHEVYRDGLKTLLEKADGMKLMAEATNGAELISLCREHHPDVVLTDIIMPLMDGIAATTLITQELPNTQVIALSMYNEDHLIVDMLQAGARGYLVKNAGKQEIIEAVQTVRQNIPYYCSSTSTKLAHLISASKFPVPGTNKKPSFSPREMKIIHLICEGKTSREIADILFLSTRTVEEYRLNIRDKMEVKTTAALVVYALRNALYKF